MSKRVEFLISIWSMRPKPGTPSGDAWEAGAKQGFEWSQKEIKRLKKKIAKLKAAKK